MVAPSTNLPTSISWMKNYKSFIHSEVDLCVTPFNISGWELKGYSIVTSRVIKDIAELSKP